jgi:hypothetical protein
VDGSGAGTGASLPIPVLSSIMNNPASEKPESMLSPGSVVAVAVPPNAPIDVESVIS